MITSVDLRWLWLLLLGAFAIGWIFGWARCDRMWEARRERNGWRWPPHIPPWEYRPPPSEIPPRAGHGYTPPYPWPDDHPPRAMTTLNLFCGYDPREAVGFHTFVHSVLARASVPVQITPLASMGLPQGSNTFTVSRFLVPYLMGFRGHAIFVDGCDMLMLGDVAELDAMFDDGYAVQVVKHSDYESQHQRKYIGTEMECVQTNYAKKNHASVMIINCAHPAWEGMTPEAVAQFNALDLLQFEYLAEHDIGGLPAEWNVLIDEGQSDENAKLIHYTNGIPAFPHYQNSRRSKDWFAEFDAMTGAMQHG